MIYKTILALAIVGTDLSSPITTNAFSPSQSVTQPRSLSPNNSNNLFKSSQRTPLNKLTENTPAETFPKNARFHHLLSNRGGSEAEKKTTSSSSGATLKEMTAEALGTFLIVFLGCGTVSASVYHSAQVGLWQIASVWSIAVTLAIFCTAKISGAHLNPAISLTMALFRPKGFGWGKLPGYWVGQLFGAFLGGLMNYGLFMGSIVSFEAGNGIVRGGLDSWKSACAFGEYYSISSGSALLAEVVGTAILAFSIFSLTNSKNSEVPKGAPPPLIGMTVGALISVIAPLTQAGFNPARDFGPRLVTLLFGWGKAVSMKNWWVYVVGPMVGAPIGAFVAEKVLWGDDKE